MANQLINGAQMVTEPSVPDPNEGKLPTFGYHADGRSQVFYLGVGERLPEGWHDSPVTAALDAATAPKPRQPKPKKEAHGNGP